jgi:serine/threonine protein kinase/tetratricopeptide (TPR) repeat protein
MSLAPGKRLGPYEIESRLGAGGMGEVYRARDTRLHRLVALKVLPEDVAGDPDRRQRLQREARSIASVTHPNICTLHDVGHDSGVDYLVMEFIDGETLAARLAKGPLPLDLALRCASQIAVALSEAHRAGVVHRDLKPLNVMITRTGVKVLDFGLAKAVSRLPAVDGRGSSITREAITGTGVVMGTLPYMAPEQLDGAPVDARTDIFAFGAVLFEMITGKRAFDAPSQSRLIVQILEYHPPDLSVLQPTAPASLERLVRRCLEKDPHNRWQSTADLASQIDWIREHDLAAKVGGASPPVLPSGEKPVSDDKPRPAPATTSLPPFLATTPIPSFSGKAIWSLICGVLVFPAIAGVVLGHLARKDIQRSDGALRGGGIALAGLILGYSFLAFQVLGVVASVTVPSLQRAKLAVEREAASKSAAASVPLPSAPSTASLDSPEVVADINAEDARGLGLLNTGKANEAIAVYEALIAKYPAVHRLHVRLAEAYADANNPAMSLTQIRLALQKEPDNLDYRILEAEQSLRLGDVGGAQKILDTVDLAKVTNPRALSGAADVRIGSGDKGHAATAIGILNSLIAQFPDDALLLYHRARAYLIIDKKSDARKDLEKFIASVPPESPLVPAARRMLEDASRKRPWWKF